MSKAGNANNVCKYQKEQLKFWSHLPLQLWGDKNLNSLMMDCTQFIKECNAVTYSSSRYVPRAFL